MKRWFIILCVMIFSVGCTETNTSSSETETKQQEERIEKTCEECGHYGNDVISNSALDDTRKLCRECMRKARKKQRESDKKEKAEIKQQEEKEKENSKRIIYEDDNIIIKLRVQDMDEFLLTRAEGDFYVETNMEIINKKNEQVRVGFIEDGIIVNNTPRDFIERTYVSNNYDIIDSQLSVYSSKTITNYNGYCERIIELDADKTSIEFTRWITGYNNKPGSKILCNIENLTFYFRVNDSEVKEITVNDIDIENDPDVEERLNNIIKQQEEEKIEKEEAERIAEKREEEFKNTAKTEAEEQWNNANDKQLIYSDDMFKIYAYDKHFNGSKFEFRMRLESNSDEPYSFGVAARQKTAYTRGRGSLSSSSYYEPIVYLNGVEYEGYIDIKAHESGYYENYFVKRHTYLTCEIDSYDHFNIKSLNNIEFNVIAKPINTPPDLGENNTRELNINFNI